MTQRRIAEYLAADFGVQQIADAIEISVESVRYHIGELRWKLNVQNKHGIVGAYLRLTAGSVYGAGAEPVGT